MEDKKIFDALTKYISETGDDWNYILPDDLEEVLKKENNYFLLDVRRPEDFNRSHIKGSKSIFWKEVIKPENLAKLPKDKTIVLICYVGHTASQVVVMLNLLGYNAVVLKYGMGHSALKGVPISGWSNLSYDTESLI